MAKFSISESITGRNEGGYAHNVADSGGETYAGVSRNNWPSWVGWKHIDSIKERYGRTAAIINKHAKQNPVLQTLISDFYKNNFWDVNKLDEIKDQQIADSVYDFGVNSGTGRAARMLQDAVNNTGNINIKVDRKIGNTTLSAVNLLNPVELHSKFNSLRRAFYNNIAKGSQKQFLNSWLSRLKPYSTTKLAQYVLGLTPDGVYGPKTKQAVIEFQKSKGLVADGIIGNKTIEALHAS